MPYQCNPRYARRAAFSPFGGLQVLGGLMAALDDKSGQCSVPTVRPNFDVYETKESYVLEGELPGVSDKKSIQLQFTDAQTLSVKGFVGRTRRGGNSDAEEKGKEEEKAAEDLNSQSLNEKSDAEMSDATLENDTLVEGLTRKESPAPSYHATVEDESDDDDKSDFEVVNTPRTNTPAPPVAGGPAADEKRKEGAPAADSTPSADAAKAAAKEQCRRRCGNGQKYWVSERSAGAFHRTFSFSGLVNQDAVKAHLENGLLTIVVPKRLPSVTRVNIE